MPRFTTEGRPDAVAEDAAAEMLNDPATAPAAEKAIKAADANMSVRIAERLSQSASTSAVFAAPVERSGITVIPVARASYGFGAGTRGEGSGGGGGVSVTPVGWIEITGAGSTFRPLRPTGQAIAVTLAAFGLVAGTVALRRTSRGSKRRQLDEMLGRLARRGGSRIARMRRR